MPVRRWNSAGATNRGIRLTGSPAHRLTAAPTSWITLQRSTKQLTPYWIDGTHRVALPLGSVGSISIKDGGKRRGDTGLRVRRHAGGPLSTRGCTGMSRRTKGLMWSLTGKARREQETPGRGPSPEEHEGMRAYQEGRYTDAEKFYRHALRQAEQSGADDDRVAAAACDVAEIYRAPGEVCGGGAALSASHRAGGAQPRAGSSVAGAPAQQSCARLSRPGAVRRRRDALPARTRHSGEVIGPESSQRRPLPEQLARCVSGARPLLRRGASLPPGVGAQGEDARRRIIPSSPAASPTMPPCCGAPTAKRRRWPSRSARACCSTSTGRWRGRVLRQDASGTLTTESTNLPSLRRRGPAPGGWPPHCCALALARGGSVGDLAAAAVAGGAVARSAGAPRSVVAREPTRVKRFFSRPRPCSLPSRRSCCGGGLGPPRNSCSPPPTRSRRHRAPSAPNG